MPHHGRQLTLFALYHSYTGDPSGLLLKHYAKIQGIVNLLRHLRARSLQRNHTDPAYGMPAGNDEADLFQDCIECGTTFGDTPGDCVTELPYISIAAEMIRGFMELGEVLQLVGADAQRPDVTAEGAAMAEPSCAKLLSVANLEMKRRRPRLALALYEASLKSCSCRA